jgi:hypothetical protein
MELEDDLPPRTGRKSAASGTVVPLPGAQQRPGAPKEFSPAEIALWDEIVDSMPAHWFVGAPRQLLKQFVAHSVALDVVAADLRSGHSNKMTPMERARIIATHERGIKIMAEMMRHLRLTPASRARRNRDEGISQVAKVRPWEDDD